MVRTSIHKLRKYTIRILGGIILCILILVFVSYFNSKASVEDFLGGSLEFVELYKSGIAIEPFGEKSLWWRFTFNVKGASDEFTIYTTLCGNITTTTPHKIDKSDLIKFEKDMRRRHMELDLEK